METKKCPYCGKTVLAVSKVCKHCGKSFDEIQTVQEAAIASTPLIEVTEAEEKVPTPRRIETKKCPACGKTILAVSEVCKHCGKLFEKPVQEEKPEITIFQPQSQTTNNELANLEPIAHISEQTEQEPTELSQLEEEPENKDTNQSESPGSSQQPTPFIEQQGEYETKQNFDKQGPIKTLKWIIYVLGGILLIGGSAFGLLKLNKQNHQTQESVQVPKEDTIYVKEKVPSQVGLEPTLLYSTPAEIASSSGERFKVEAGDYFIGTLDEKGNPENGKLYDKNGRPKHVILPRRNN